MRATVRCHDAVADVHHETVHFTGRVQGVGFRYQTLQVARGYEVSGWVRNLADGRVELEAEGEMSEVEAFVAALAGQMEGYIREIHRHAQRGPARHRGFVIR